MAQRKLIWEYSIGDTFIDEKRNLIIKNTNIKIRERIGKSGNLIRAREKWYDLICNKCGCDIDISEEHLKAGRGCPVCVGRRIVIGYNDLATTHPEVIKYLDNPEDGFTQTAYRNKKIPCHCDLCGYKKPMSPNKLVNRGFHCPRCSDGISYPNKFMFNLLEQLDIDFVPEYYSKWTNGRFYDFYFEYNDKKYIVEMDGALGHGVKVMPNGLTLEETLLIDKEKDATAYANGIDNVIRIDCNYNFDGITERYEIIKNNILSSVLSTLFDLSKVDFLLCNQFALSNRVKEACELYLSGLSTYEISISMKISRATAIQYLHLGDKVGWCDYKCTTKKNIDC